MDAIRRPIAVARVIFLLAFAFGSVSTAARAGDPDQSEAQSLKQLSLEALGNIEVTSVSKDPEEIRLTAAAIHVISNDDIRRSGATTLPEVLRLAPGLDVARIDTTHWSVGVRGFGDQFSKSVLVLMDGRSVYTPLFGGVFWALQDMPLSDVDHIEVIRGPGGTIWGSNAVNGVINIVTKNSALTQGVTASLRTGNVDRAVASVRYGGGNEHGLNYRVYGKAFRREPQQHSDDHNFDIWRMGQMGGRADLTGARDVVTVQGDVYSGDVGQSVSLASFSPPAQAVNFGAIGASGGNLVATWRRALAHDSHIRTQVYYDRTNLDAPQVGERRDTLDIDFTHELPTRYRQRLMWGTGARISPSDITQTVPTLDFSPRSHTEKIYSAFVQDEIHVVPKRLMLTVGAKFGHYTYTGMEKQPSVRVLWSPTPRHSFWTAVTRAVRTPSRLERDFVLNGFLTATPIPTYVRIAGNPDFESERLLGYEGGYRGSVMRDFFVDVSFFHNQHSRLEALGASSVVIETTPPPTRALLVFPYDNGVRGTSNGVEIAPRWKPTSSWQLRGFYAYLQLNLENEPGNLDTGSVTTYEGSSPRHQALLQSQVDLPGGWEAEQSIRYVSALPARDVKAYTEADLRLGWRSNQGIELSIAGQNLLNASHLEFGHDPGPAVGIRRSFVVTVTLNR